MDKTITVTGSGIACGRSNAAVINSKITGTKDDYQKVVRVSAETLSSLRKLINDAGFEMDDLKTISFSVNTIYRSTQNGAPTFTGYRYSHGILITVDIDGDSLGKLLGATTSCDVVPEFRVLYIVRDPSELIRGARQSAVKDAKHRARELVSATDVKLWGIISIEYVSRQSVAVPRARVMSVMAIDTVPKDVEYHNLVTIKWEIL